MQFPLIICADFVGAHIIQTICKDNEIPFCRIKDYDPTEEKWHGLAIESFGCQVREHPTVNARVFDPRTFNPEKSAIEQSYIGQFFKLFDIHTDADAPVYASAVAQLAPWKGFIEKFEEFSKTQYEDNIGQYIEQFHDLHWGALSTGEKLKYREIVSGVYDCRFMELTLPDLLWVYSNGACVFKEIGTAKGGMSYSLTGPFTDPVLDWFYMTMDSVGCSHRSVFPEIGYAAAAPLQQA